MTTVRKTLVNGHNAGSSSGPRSVKGKELAAQNAQVHGLRAQKGLLPWELDEQYNAIKARFWEELGAGGAGGGDAGGGDRAESLAVGDAVAAV